MVIFWYFTLSCFIFGGFFLKSKNEIILSKNQNPSTRQEEKVKLIRLQCQRDKAKEERKVQIKFCSQAHHWVKSPRIVLKSKSSLFRIQSLK